jgi:type IV secretion system protein VirD4
MTLNISDNFWAKAGLIVLSVVVVSGLWVYLAGGIFMLGIGQKLEDASLLTMYQYWVHYGDNPGVQKWLSIGAGGALAALLLPGVLFILPAKKRSLFGDARFAKMGEIVKAGFHGVKGIIVGWAGGRYLMFDGQQHVLISAPTRSGKGVGIVIPNLLNWAESAVVLDVKKENFLYTSAYRHKYGQKVYLFDPTAHDYRSHRYNPLSYISSDPIFQIDDIQKIGNMLFPDVQGTDVIWTATPRSLFLGVVLYLLETPGKLVTFGQVLRETLSEGDSASYFAKIINDRAKAHKPLSNACVYALNTYISISADATRSGIITGFRSRLELWMNPLVDAATSSNDFDLRDLRRKRMTIYLGTAFGNLDRLAPLFNLFFQQLIDLNTRELPSQDSTIKYTCLLLMDEFTAMGKIPILSKGIGFIAGYLLRMVAIIQSPAQLVSTYGEAVAQTYQTNHALQIIYPPKISETRTLEDISKWLGYQTVKSLSSSKAKSFFGKKTPTENQSDQRRALLLPQEISSLGQNRELIVAENMPPILAKKIEFFKDAAYVDRLKEVSPKLKAFGGKRPTKAQWEKMAGEGEFSIPIPEINIEEHTRNVGNHAPIIVTTPKKGGTTQPVNRPVTPADIPNLAKMGLADFAIDFSAVEKPPLGELNEAALTAYADNLCRQAGISVISLQEQS